MQAKPQKVRAVPGGYETRLRFGKGQRGRFTINTRDELTALARATRLADAAALLATSKKDEHAKALLERAAAWEKETDFGKAIKWISDFVAGKRQIEAPTPSGGLTFQQLGERWTNEELARDYPDHVRKKKSVDDDVYRLESIIYPEIGPVPLVSFQLEDAERAMRKLPADLSPASRRHYAQLISRILSLAVYPARVIKVSPIPRGWLPKLGARKAFAYLYPTEDAKLMASTGANGVPLAYRLLYGFLAREGMRRGEAFQLTFADLDLDTGAVRLDENKTDDPRAWALDPGTRAALKIWKDDYRPKAKPGDFVFVDRSGEALDEEKLADRLREHLEIAKVSRPELFKSTNTRHRLRAHDLRGTFVTLALASGKTETWVMDRTGHTTSGMLQRYRRAARSAAELGLGALAPLDQAIPEFRKVGQKVGQTGGSGGKAKKTHTRKTNASASVHEERLELSRFSPPEPKGEESMQERARPSDVSDLDAGACTKGHDGQGLAHVLAHPVDVALAEALTEATRAGRWDVVAEIARELAARRR
jgi:integrase